MYLIPFLEFSKQDKKLYIDLVEIVANMPK